MESKSEEDDLARKRKLIYERVADSTLEFENGECLQVNKILLAFESEYFDDLFFGPSPVTKVKISHFDRETFQIFLDCLFELKEYSVFDVLRIYPIAYELDFTNCLRKCVSVLKPTKMDATICLTLKLALYYECEELVSDVLNFLKNKVGVAGVLENKNYSKLLDSTSMSKLIETVRLDSYIWKVIYEWGKDQAKNQDVRSFFSETDIPKKFSLAGFESIQAIFDFQKLTNKLFVSSDQIIEFLENNLKKLPEKSCWVEVEKNEEVVEKIVFKNSVIVSPEDLTTGLKLNISINSVRPKIMLNEISSNTGNCRIRCNFGVVFQNFSKKSETPISPIRPLRSPIRANATSSTIPNYSCAIAVPPRSLNFTVEASNSNVSESGVTETFYDISENFNVYNFKKISVAVSQPHQLAEIKSLDIVYTFPFYCRILKSSISGNFVRNDELYFTNDVDYS